MAETGKQLAAGTRRAGKAVAGASTPATVILFLALLTGIVGRWAHGKSLPSGTGLLQIVFALVVITALDRGETRPIARGFAYLFLAAVLLGPDSPLDVLNKKLPTKPPAKPSKGPKKGK